MGYYICIFLLLLFSVYTGKGNYTKQNNWFWYIILPLFLCTGYLVGSDWRGYELDYYSVSFNEIFGGLREEPAYYVIGWFFRKIGFGFWEYAILVKLIGYYVFLYIFKQVSLNNVFGLIYWFPNFALFLWIDHPARNFVAVIIFSWALLYIRKIGFLKYLLLCIIGATFHFTCLALVPLYFIRNYQPRKYLVLLVCLVLFFMSTKFIAPYLESFLTPLNLYNRLESYVTEDNTNAASIGRFLLILTILALGSLNIERMRKKYANADFVLVMAYAYAFYFSMTNIQDMFFRLQYYMIVPFCVLIGYVSCSLSKILRIGFKVVIISFSLFFLVNLTTRSYAYIPYSSYLEYIFKDKPSYNERDNYNYKYSPYRYKTE